MLTAKDGQISTVAPIGQSFRTAPFTDEPALTFSQGISDWRQLFGPFAQLTHAYLLFSYDPGTKSYPVVRVAMEQ